MPLLVAWKCAECESTERKGRAKGLCRPCYLKAYKSRPGYRTPEQIEQRRQYSAMYHQKHKATRNPEITERRRELRRRVVETLGGKCACCQETTPAFLTLDHVQNDGAAVRHLQRHLIYRMVEAEGYPKDRYQILCWNCNAAKGMLGACPHSAA